ncbi:outer membrane lipoprotein carrier protein LolA [Zooshikella ganghwensis]|uniref:outer membrane lipoprotein carrier protein LolA n=1 Tax=Zooshikella ganghwensis TaxID=202772 RepID=UPI000426532A|nr:outer membrane lipoprotein carrier protein LolA [Zooshikella ganghwensis]
MLRSKVIAFLVLFFVSLPFITKAASTKNEAFWQYWQNQMLAKSLSGKFLQEKHIAVLRKPLVSKGTFKVESDKVDWMITFPITKHFTFDQNGIVDHLKSTNQANVISNDQALKQFSAIFRPLFTGDKTQLQQFFSINIRKLSEDKWELDLRPKDELLRKGLVNVELVINQVVNIIRITETNGDKTLIKLLDVQTVSTPN